MCAILLIESFTWEGGVELQRFKVTVKAESGISCAIRNYCNKCGISVWTFLATTITERLRKPLDFSIAEIERKRTHESGKDERFDFGISDAIVLEKLRIIREDYGVPLNYFFVRTIAEKLTELGYTLVR